MPARDKKAWVEARLHTPEKLKNAHRVLQEIIKGCSMGEALRRNPLPDGKGYVAKHVLVAEYYNMVERGEIEEDPALLTSIRMKPVRTLSGVTTVTVLTKPYPCPGACIFCPSDERMPKSYLPDEPGAARAFENDFDPFAQVKSRLDALKAVGHPTDKIELLILGGTWDAYPSEYQEWFVLRCFDAMNEVDSPNLSSAQNLNETARQRNVGLVIETRPDQIQPNGLVWLRRMGVTKLQMGAQSLDDRLLQLNCRGHAVADTLQACALLRAAGYKIVLHWMPNLLGATIDSDRQDFSRLWNGFCPDEIKIYPTQLLENTVLHQHWQQGEYQPYTTGELIGLIADVKSTVPSYCRINRVIRDIPSSHVVEGNKRTSLRQDALMELARRGQSCACIRCREVRGGRFDAAQLHLDDMIYHPAYAEEHFLSFLTPQNQITGYLRLSLPDFWNPKHSRLPEGQTTLQEELFHLLPDLRGVAIIREVHVYGQSLPVGGELSGAAQHIGLGTQLLEKAAEIARQRGFEKLAVISAIGTRRYYQARGFEQGELYQVKNL